MEESRDTTTGSAAPAAVTALNPPSAALPVPTTVTSTSVVPPTTSTSLPPGPQTSPTPISASTTTPTAAPAHTPPPTTAQAASTSNTVPPPVAPVPTSIPTPAQATSTSNTVPPPVAPVPISLSTTTQATPTSNPVPAPVAPVPTSIPTPAQAASTSNPVPPAVAQGPTSLPTTTPATPNSNPVPPLVTPAAPVTPAVPSSPAPQRQNQDPPTPRLTRKPIRAKLWALKAPAFALVIVVLVDSLTLSAPSTRSPLGSISYTSGVLVLSILSTLTGYSLAGAAQAVWDRARFGMFAKEHGSGQSLVVFWTVSTEVWGSCLILWREICNLFRRRTGSNNQNVNVQTPAGTPPHARGHPKFWSSLRIISWIAMQFPGIIIMTLLNVKTSYITVRWIPITGGIGIYDPTAVVPGADPILITSSALSILQDLTRSVPVDPINKDCINAGDSCKSFLLPGGLGTVSPWPYQKLRDKSLEVYVTKGGPAYQVDFWSPPDNVTWASDDCTVYAASKDLGLQLCTSFYGGGTSQIIAGWTSCAATGTVLPSGECSQDGSWEAFNRTMTILSVARRTATVYALRETSMIVAWEDLGKPELQSITPGDFKAAFDIMMVPWSNSTSSLPSGYSTYQLTAQIAFALSLDLLAPGSSRSLDYLQNLFATPLYVFNPLVLGLRGDPPDTYDLQPDLLPENHINGSYAKKRVHVVPQRWTVLTFVAVSGLFLLICFVALAVSTAYEGPDSSLFPFVDALKLKWVVPGGEGKEVEDIREVFQGVDLDKDLKVLEHAARVGVKLRTN